MGQLPKFNTENEELSNMSVCSSMGPLWKFQELTDYGFMMSESLILYSENHNPKKLCIPLKCLETLLFCRKNDCCKIIYTGSSLNAIFGAWKNSH